jgi:hypothetical protein
MEHLTTCSENAEDILTIEALTELIAKLPPPPKWKASVVRPQVLARLRELEAPTPSASVFLSTFGMPLYEKNQMADCWIFSDFETLEKYLNGDLTEMDLVNLALSGVCRETQNSFSNLCPSRGIRPNRSPKSPAHRGDSISE